MNSKIDERRLAEICPEIRVLLDAELAAGGQIVRVSRGLDGGDKVLVVDLKHNYFSIENWNLPDGVSFHGKDIQCAIGDHFYCTKHDHCLMAALR